MPNSTTTKRNRRSHKEDATRFNLYLPEEAYDALKTLQQLTGKTSLAETIRSALRFYLVVQEARSAGKELYFMDERGDRERIVGA